MAFTGATRAMTKPTTPGFTSAPISICRAMTTPLKGATIAVSPSAVLATASCARAEASCAALASNAASAASNSGLVRLSLANNVRARSKSSAAFACAASTSRTAPAAWATRAR